MARKRTVLPSAVEAEIATRTARGETAATIHAAIGGAISKPTIARRMLELRGKVPAPRPQAQTLTNTHDVPDDIPENTPLEDINRWLAKLNDVAEKAAVNENWAVVTSIGGKVATLMSLKHKHTPLPKADPNDDPDYQKIAKEGEDRLLALVRSTFGV